MVPALLLGMLGGCATLPPQAQYEQQAPPPPAVSAAALSRDIRSGAISAEAALDVYLQRIEALDRSGPQLHSIIALNPEARAQARLLDAEARSGQFRGALHGVPVLLKDNIESTELPTTAGSLALRENHTGRDAPLVAGLKSQGAIVLGKANLSEWANFRDGRSISGWSAVGGLSRNPHRLDRGTCGSSSGSAVAVAAQLAPLSIGTETNGSITCPAAMVGVVGFKPTVGLVSRRHVVPLSHSQDSAGPLAQTVEDVALALEAMAGTDPEDPATALADQRRQDYVAALDTGIAGMRIGVFRWAQGKDPNVVSAFEAALEVLRAAGAELVDIHDFEPDPVLWRSGLDVLRTEFKASINAYLEASAPAVTTRSLAQLIEFNRAHASRELALFGQSLFVEAQQTEGLTDPQYLRTVARVQEASRSQGIDRLLDEYQVEVLVMPSAPPSRPVDLAHTSKAASGPVGAGWLAAMAGYPILSVPMGAYRNLPLGLSITSRAWQDAVVLRVGHAYQRAAEIELVPGYLTGPFDDPQTAPLLRPYLPEAAPQELD